ncbi:MAG: glycosyltransferase family 39 protein [Chloroflexi bacterium]|nr:glycosyltransferase family 39 protein [Chloroflexota bacterium]
MLDYWRRLDPAWRFAIGVYVVARVLFTAWSLIVFLIFPSVLQNLDLFGMPVVAVFDLGSGDRFVYSRQVEGTTLVFRAGEHGRVTDAQTSTVWALDDGRALSGAYAGRALAASAYPVEDIFPYRGVAPNPNPLFGLWQRFDTNWYLKIAERGYSADDGSTVYFPLYPLLIRVASSVLLGQNLVAALLISNLALVGVFHLLYQIADERGGSNNAARAVVFLALFPTAFFLFGAYTESLFLLCALASLRSGTRGYWARAGLFGALAALTRLQGVLLVVPLAYLWWKARLRRPLPCRWSSDGGGLGRGLMLLAIPLATTAFLAWQYLFVGNASLVGAYEGQLHARFVMPWENVAASLALVAGAQASFVDILNLLTTILFGVMLAGMWRRRSVPPAFLLYAVLMYLAPLFRMTTTQPLVSMMRYVLAMFPVFVVWGAWGRNPWVNRAIVYLSFPLGLYLSAQFVMWGWVG